MNELKNWTEVTKGLYRYVIGANACYELHIVYHDLETDISTAKASLYLVVYNFSIFFCGWCDAEGNSFFERQCLLSEKPVFECLEYAVKDDKENNNG